MPIAPGRRATRISDPRSACFYSRRAVEHLVDYLYDVLALTIPYQNDLVGADQ